MVSLTDSILSLEAQANALVEEARGEAARISKEADARIEIMRAETIERCTNETEQTLAPRRTQLEQELKLAATQAEKALSALDSLSDGALRQQAQRVVARLSES